MNLLLVVFFLLSIPIINAEDATTAVAEEIFSATDGTGTTELETTIEDGATTAREELNATIRLLAPEYSSFRELASPLELLQATLEFALETPQVRSLPMTLGYEPDGLSCDYTQSMERIMQLRCEESSMPVVGSRVPRLIIGPLCSYAVNNAYLWYMNRTTDSMITVGGHSSSLRENKYDQLVRIGTSANQDQEVLTNAFLWLSGNAWKRWFFALRGNLNPISAQRKNSTEPKYYMDNVHCRNLQKDMQATIRDKKQFVHEYFYVDSSVGEDKEPTKEQMNAIYTRMFLQKIGSGRASK